MLLVALGTLMLRGKGGPEGPGGKGDDRAGETSRALSCAGVEDASEPLAVSTARGRVSRV